MAVNGSGIPIRAKKHRISQNRDAEEVQQDGRVTKPGRSQPFIAPFVRPRFRRSRRDRSPCLHRPFPPEVREPAAAGGRGKVTRGHAAIDSAWAAEMRLRPPRVPFVDASPCEARGQMSIGRTHFPATPLLARVARGQRLQAGNYFTTPISTRRFFAQASSFEAGSAGISAPKLTV